MRKEVLAVATGLLVAGLVLVSQKSEAQRTCCDHNGNCIVTKKAYCPYPYIL